MAKKSKKPKQTVPYFFIVMSAPYYIDIAVMKITRTAREPIEHYLDDRTPGVITLWSWPASCPDDNARQAAAVGVEVVHGDDRIWMLNGSLHCTGFDGILDSAFERTGFSMMNSANVRAARLPTFTPRPKAPSPAKLQAATSPRAA